MPRRFIIYGAGAIGGVIGGGLALGGHRAVLIARGAHLAALQTNGLDLRTPTGAHTLDLDALADPGDAELTADDIVVVATKTQDTPAVLDRLVEVAPPEIAIVCAQNGVENERMALRHFANVYAMCVYLPGIQLDPGVVVCGGSPIHGILDVGRYPSGVDDTATEIAAALSGSGFRSVADPTVMRHKYAKLRVNTGNALDAACGREARTSDLAKRAAREALDVYEAAGLDVATRDEVAERRDGFSIAEVDGESRAGSSSWQSLAKGSGSIEADYLNGEIVLLGRLHGVATPVNEALRRLANRLARDQEAPGSLTLDEVEALVDEDAHLA